MQNHWITSPEDILRNNASVFRFPTIGEQYQLVDKGLATVKENETGEMVLFKYHRRVMYDYLWKTDANLMECRGHVYNKATGRLVVAPPRKSFNYGEQGWWQNMPLDTIVYAARKYNGFLACNTMGMITTTGSFNSDYVSMAKEFPTYPVSGCTAHYEIIHPEDPHIVDEVIGFKPLCYRSVYNGHQYANNIVRYKLSDILNMCATEKHEGYMVYHHTDFCFLSPCKIKTDYYIGKKKLMRMNKSGAEMLWSKNWKQFVNNMPNKWHRLTMTIATVYTADQWLNTPEQDRRKIIEELEVSCLD